MSTIAIEVIPTRSRRLPRRAPGAVTGSVTRSLNGGPGLHQGRSAPSSSTRHVPGAAFVPRVYGAGDADGRSAHVRRAVPDVVVPCVEQPAAVRLTRRGRVVVVLAVLALAFALATVFGPDSAATGRSGTTERTRTVEVRPGDTLWDIASRVAPPGEVRGMVHRIEELNALPGPGVSVGQEISVPVG